MVEHRRIPGGKVAVPAGWFIVLSVVACVGAAGWLGFMLVGPGSASAEDVEAAGTASASATPAPVATTPEPTDATPTPQPTPTDEPARRTASVSVFNNTSVGNLARTYSAKVSGAGWTVSGVGNWRGQIESNTVYYPSTLQDQAELLASDVGISRVLPSVAPMRMDRLTMILSGPQQ